MPNLYGPGVDDAERASAEKGIQKMRKEAKELVAGEVEKTPEGLAQISLINEMLAQEYRELGVGEHGAVLPEQIHIIDNKAFDKLPGLRCADGFANIIKDAVYMKEGINDASGGDGITIERGGNYYGADDVGKYLEDITDQLVYDAIEEFGKTHSREQFDSEETYDKAMSDFIDQWVDPKTAEAEAEFETAVAKAQSYRRLGTTLHEIIHLAGLSHAYIDKDKKKISLTRSGYDSGAYFSALNEAVVQKMTADMMEKNRRRIETPGYPLDTDDFKSSGPYATEMQALDMVIWRIAKHRGESKDEVWTRFKKNYFTGGMMHLRDLERALGPGALRAYANIPRESEVMTRVEDWY